MQQLYCRTTIFGLVVLTVDVTLPLLGSVLADRNVGRAYGRPSVCFPVVCAVCTVAKRYAVAVSHGTVGYMGW